MSLFKRRQILQFLSAGLGAVGLSQSKIDRYTKVLAQETPRKRALLVFIVLALSPVRFAS
jgi:hypothetical protein